MTKLVWAILIFVITGCGAGTASQPATTATVIAWPTLRLYTRTPIVFPTRTPTPNDGVAHIMVGDDYFEPANVIIQAGTMVEWWHNGTRAHSITSLQGEWLSIYPAFGSRYRLSFNIPGVYLYTCTFHAGMGGTIKVVE